MTSIKRAYADNVPFESAIVLPTTGGVNLLSVSGTVWIEQMVLEVTTALSSSVQLSFPFSPSVGSGGNVLPDISGVTAVTMWPLLDFVPAAGDTRVVSTAYSGGLILTTGTLAVQSSSGLGSGGVRVALTYLPGTGKSTRP